MKKQYILEQRIENIAENNEDENLDYTTLFDQLSHYYEHPINLNKKNIKFMSIKIVDVLLNNYKFIVIW